MHGELNKRIRSLKAGIGEVPVKRVDGLSKFDFSIINLVFKIDTNYPTILLRCIVLPINTGFNS